MVSEKASRIRGKLIKGKFVRFKNIGLESHSFMWLLQNLLEMN